MSTIIVQVREAYAPIPGMIAAKLNGPPLLRQEVNTMQEAIILIDQEHKTLKEYNISHTITTICYGRKPKGWNNSKNLLRKDFITE